MLKSWLLAICASSIIHLVCSPPPPSATSPTKFWKTFVFFFFLSTGIWVVPGEIKDNYANFVMSRNWPRSPFARRLWYTLFVPSSTKFFITFGFYFYWVFQSSQKKFGGEGPNKKLYYNVQIAKKSQVSALELSLSISCGWYSNLCLHCQTFFAFRHFSHILSYLPQIQVLKNIFELQDFLNSPVTWKKLSTVTPVFNRTRKLAPSSDRAIIFAINN